MTQTLALKQDRVSPVAVTATTASAVPPEGG